MARTTRPKVPMRRLGGDCLVVVMKRGNARGAKGQVIAIRAGQPAREEPADQWKAEK